MTNSRSYSSTSHHLLVEGKGWDGKGKRLDVSLKDKPVPRSKEEVDQDTLAEFEWVDRISVVTISRQVEEKRDVTELQ